jgi:hypothetical protein
VHYRFITAAFNHRKHPVHDSKEYIAALNTTLRASSALTRKGFAVTAVGSYSLLIPAEMQR